MPIRRFDATDDQIAVSLGGCNLASSAYSIAVLVRPRAAEENTLIQFRDSKAEEQVEFGWEPNRDPYLWTPGGSVLGSEIGTPSLNQWCILAVTKASGSAKPSWHFYDFASWEHKEDGSSIGNAPSLAGGSVLLRGNYEFGECDLAAIAVWKANLNNSQVEALSAAKALGDWATLNSPAAVWLFDQKSVSEAVNDRTAGGANQTSRTGTTVVEEEPPIPYAEEEEPEPSEIHAHAGGVWKAATRHVKTGGEFVEA